MGQGQRYHRISRSFPPVFSGRKVYFLEKHWLSEHDIPPSLIVSIDQTPLLHDNTRKYKFICKGAKNIPLKGVDDKCQITATFVVSYTGEFVNPANLCRENRAKSGQAFFSTFLFGNFHRKSFVKRTEMC